MRWDATGEVEMNDNTGAVMWWILGLLAAIGFAVAMTAGARDDAGALHAAEASGFRDPALRDVSYWTQISGCSKGDSVTYQIEAHTRDGEPVALVVCGGLWKAFTVRVR
jgi:hypothetical protein